MDDEADRLSNACMDLVALRRFEPSVVALLREHGVGEWVAVDNLYRKSDSSAKPISASLHAAWLPSVDGDPEYTVILFHDADTKWSMTAEYNLSRLPASAPKMKTEASSATR